MGKYRKSRVNDAVSHEMAVIIRDVKDPRVSDSLITVTGADVSPDFKYAKIFYSVLGADGDSDAMKEIQRGLKSAAGFIRGQLAKRLNLRVTPELTFVPDESIMRGVSIAAMINGLEFTDDGEEGDDGEESENGEEGENVDDGENVGNKGVDDGGKAYAEDGKALGEVADDAEVPGEDSHE